MPLAPRLEGNRWAVYCLHCKRLLVGEIRGTDFHLEIQCSRCKEVNTVSVAHTGKLHVTPSRSVVCEHCGKLLAKSVRGADCHMKFECHRCKGSTRVDIAFPMGIRLPKRGFEKEIRRCAQG